MTLKMRRGYFLASTARVGLHGGIIKDGEGHDDKIDISPGFAEAAERMAGDDSRTPEQKAAAALEAGEDPVDNNPEGASGDDPADKGGDAGEDDDGEEGDEALPRGKRKTAEYIRELKRERREDRAALRQMQADMAALKNGGLPASQSGDNSNATREDDPAPDPNDAKKYPLGVLDDGFITDKIEWGVRTGVRKALDGERQTEQAQTQQQAEAAHLGDLKTKVDTLTDRGTELFDDFEETVLEPGMRGDYDLSEPTFLAAFDADHGAQILYDLSRDKAEASRVAKLSPYNQAKFVLEKNAEIAKTAKPRTKPAAGAPPGDPPRGRNSSSPIRPDTDNLDDFRKLYYKK